MLVTSGALTPERAICPPVLRAQILQDNVLQVLVAGIGLLVLRSKRMPRPIPKTTLIPKTTEVTRAHIQYAQYTVWEMRFFIPPSGGFGLWESP